MRGRTAYAPIYYTVGAPRVNRTQSSQAFNVGESRQSICRDEWVAAGLNGNDGLRLPCCEDAYEGHLCLGRVRRPGVPGDLVTDPWWPNCAICIVAAGRRVGVFDEGTKVLDKRDPPLRQDRLKFGAPLKCAGASLPGLTAMSRRR